MTNIIEIKKQVTQELSNPETMNALVATTFKGLTPENVKRAMVEGYMRGFKFQDFLEKNVYAIPFSDGYSLVTSIDYARKIGMRSGVVGTSAPTYEEKDGQVISCTITVKRKVNEYIGEYSATVFFSEYNNGKKLWINKPRTMIAKVAEMHALRKACPEELSQSYSEEEVELPKEKTVLETTEFEEKLKATKTLEELRSVFASLSGEMKKLLRPLADELKKKYTNETPQISK
jgi:hypothetical protein